MPEESTGPVSENFKEAPNVYLASFATKFAEFPKLQTQFVAEYKKPGFKALQAKALADGFKPMTALTKEAYFGTTNTLKSNDGRTATFDMMVHSYEKPGSKDQAAVATVKVRAGDKSETYQFLLVAPGGNFEKAQEYMIGPNNTVIEAHSWWTRFRRCVTSKCGTVCLGATVSCSGTWAAYLLCLVAVCGSCVLRCVACASCNCRWWCRWAVGCCEG